MATLLRKDQRSPKASVRDSCSGIMLRLSTAAVRCVCRISETKLGSSTYMVGLSQTNEENRVAMLLGASPSTPTTPAKQARNVQRTQACLLPSLRSETLTDGVPSPNKNQLALRTLCNERLTTHMSLRGRPSLSGTPGRSSLQPSEPRVDLAQLRLLLLSARDLPCFQVRASLELT